MEIVNAYVAICKLHVLLFFLFFSHNFITRIFHVIEVSTFFFINLFFLNSYVLTNKLLRLLSMHVLIRMLFYLICTKSHVSLEQFKGISTKLQYRKHRIL